jgi:hypothetical protein
MRKEEAVPKNNKKPYQTPALRVYGDIVSITATAGALGMTDSGTLKGHMMTH